MTFDLEGEVWLWPGDAAWHFVTLPEDVADEISDITEGRRGGFGSVRVEVTVGATTWSTSIFPDTKRGSYLLPLKAAVRKKEDLVEGSPVSYRLRLIDREP